MAAALDIAIIQEAADRIHAYLQPTALIHSRAFSDIFSAEVWLKLESYQPTGSFKVRGALNKMFVLQQAGNLKGVVTGSAGNHGLGVAYAADALGIQPIAIVIPENAPLPKKEKLGRFSLELVEEGSTYEQAHQAALQLAADRGWAYISAYDDLDVIAGQGTIALEVLAEKPNVDIVVVPVGGGGLIAGIASVVKQIRPMSQVVGVQAAASPSGRLSLMDGHAYDPFDHAPTIADGLAGGFGAVPFTLAQTLIDRIELADEQQLRDAVYDLLEYESILAEPSGAISTHPLVKTGEDWMDRTVVCIISGGNLSLPMLQAILDERRR